MINVLREQIMAGEAKRDVDFVILDVTKNLDAKGKTRPTDNWVKLGAQHMLDQVWNEFKLLTWCFVTTAMCAPYEGSQVLPTWLAGLEENVTWKSAVQGTTEMASWDNLPLPPDEYRPDEAYVNTAEGYKVAMFRYANTKWTFPGITNAQNTPVAVPLWMFNGSKFMDIPLVRGTSAPEEPPVEPENPIDPEDPIDPETPELAGAGRLSTMPSWNALQAPWRRWRGYTSRWQSSPLLHLKPRTG